MPIIVFSQKTDTIPFKKAAKIIIKNNLTAAENFKQCGLALIEKGYMIGEKDEQFGQISSQPIKTTFGHEVIFLVAKDNEIQIIGRFKNGNVVQVVGWMKTESSATPVTYGISQYDKEKFNHLINLAKVIKSDSLLYSE